MTSNQNENIGTNRRSFIGRSAAAGMAIPTLLPSLGLGNPSGALAQDATPAGQPLDEGTGGTLVIDLNFDPETLDPHQGLTAAASFCMEQMFESFVRFKPGTVEIEPWLAESWDTSEDGLTWTFHLRQGVLFHDGTPFNAEAVKFNYDRQFDPANEFNALGQWTAVASFDFLESVSVVDEFTVEFKLSRVYNKFLLRLGGLSWVSPAAVQASREGFGENPVGTGPFAFQQWDKGQQVVLKRNDNWWGGVARLDQVVFRAIIEPGARTAALLSGEVNLTVQISPEIAQQIETESSLRVESAGTGSVWFLAMNVEFPKFSDLRVRQAINCAIDKEVIVSAVLGDTVDVAHGPLAPSYIDYNPKVTEYYAYDPERAKQLLTDAAYVDDTPIVFRVPIGDPSMLAAEEMATVIQDNLREVGISTEIETSDAVSWMDAIRAPQNELTEMSWNLAPVSPDDVFSGVLSRSSLPPGFNTSYWVNEEFEELLLVGSTSLDEAEVNAAYMRCQEIVMEEAPIVPVCHRRSLYGVSNLVHNFRAQPGGGLFLIEVWVEA
jgi:peptide/nickel transport system substrate-binding protein